MKSFGLSFLALATTALVTEIQAAVPSYKVETTITRNGKPEITSMLLEPNVPAAIQIIDSKSKEATYVDVTLETVDSETVFLNYKFRDISKSGKEKVLAQPEMMVFLDQKAKLEESSKGSADDLGVEVLVTQPK